MAKKKSKITAQDYIKLCNNINTEIDNAYKALKELNSAWTTMMKGDDAGPYWNGSVAVKFYKTAKNNLDHDITAYKEAVEAWQALLDRYDRLALKGYFAK